MEKRKLLKIVVAALVLLLLCLQVWHIIHLRIASRSLQELEEERRFQEKVNALKQAIGFPEDEETGAVDSPENMALVETVTMDVDGDGVADIEIVAMDTDGDGIANIEYSIADLDGDGIVDLEITSVDVDGDGVVDTETVALDVDGDGVIDTIRENDYLSNISRDISAQAPYYGMGCSDA